MVIVIIAILSALMLPALSRAKGTAHRIRCVSNLHQLGLATHMYWDDNAGRCFRYGGGQTNGGQLYWFGWLGPGPEGTREFDATAGVLYPYLRGRGVEVCPALANAGGRLKLKAAGATYGYGYNLALSGGTSKPAVQGNQLARPGAIALMADAAQVNTWQAPASPENPMLEEWYYIDNSTNQPNGHFRHHRKANVLFCDGHVESERFVPDSLDPRLPDQYIGRFRPEILRLP